MLDRKDLLGVTMRAALLILAILFVFSATGMAAEDGKDCPPVPNTKMGRDCVKNCKRAARECLKSCGGDPKRARYVDCADCGRFRDACVCSCASTTRRYYDNQLLRPGR